MHRDLRDVVDLLHDPVKSSETADPADLERRLIAQGRELAARAQALRDAAAEQARLNARIAALEAELAALRRDRGGPEGASTGNENA